MSTSSGTPAPSYWERDYSPNPDDPFYGYDVQNAYGSARTVRRDMLDLLALAPGLAVLEVGCGTGEDAQVIANRVGASGRVIALDLNFPVLDEARRRAQGGPGRSPSSRGMSSASTMPTPPLIAATASASCNMSPTRRRRSASWSG